jgi:hypothetical protein
MTLDAKWPEYLQSLVSRSITCTYLRAFECSTNSVIKGGGGEKEFLLHGICQPSSHARLTVTRLSCESYTI